MDHVEDEREPISQLTSIENIDYNENLVGYEEVGESEEDEGEKYTEDTINLEENVGTEDDGSNLPILGMIFSTDEDAFNFYNNYARSKGFGIRLRYSHKSNKTNKIYRRRYVCSKEGFKNLKDKRFDEGVAKRRRETRTGCLAMLQVKLSNEEWKVEKFSNIHNHPMIVTPSKVMKFNSHNKGHLSNVCKSLVSDLNQAGLSASSISKAMNVINSDVHLTRRQCTTILSNQRRNYVGKECYGVIKHFQKKAELDESFYFVPDLSKDGTFRSVFWADGRSRTAYAQFGDVLVFDVTYRTNKFKFPFAPFVGVNHHGQSILFGAALLEDETEETFTWLFDTFRNCMFDKTPISIITDQDKAMGNAIKTVFPNARHRFCVWHIKKHFLEHLQPFRMKFKDTFLEDYKSWYKSHTIDDFERRWADLKVKYNIEDDCWFSNIYSLRNHWARAYLKDTFFAGMTTSGRSESINSFFDGYVNSNTLLNDFVVQYDKAITSRREAEEDEDFKTRNSKAVLDSDHPIEKIAGDCYTRKMFEIFRKEWRAASFDYFHEKILKMQSLIKYRVGSLKVDKEKWAIVDFHVFETFKATCSCAKFENWGILCKHILYIMKKKQVTTIPDEYILPRWTMKASYRAKNFDCFAEGSSTSSEVSALMLYSIRAKCCKAVEDAKDSLIEMRKFDSLLNEFLEQQAIRKGTLDVTEKAWEKNLGVSEVDSNVTVAHDNIINLVRDPTQPIPNKGRPLTAKRIKSGLELSMKPTSKRACGYCGEKGHYKTSCPQKKV